MEKTMTQGNYEQTAKSSKETFRTRRVGTITCGLILILYGILFVLKMIFPNINYVIIFELWPLILIFLGVEILASCGSKNQEKTKLVYDFPAVLIIFIVAVFAMIMAGVSIYYDYYDKTYNSADGGGHSNVISGSQDFAAGDISSVSLSNEFWDIKVLPSEDNDIHVSYKGTAPGEQDVVELEQIQHELVMDIKEYRNYRYMPISFGNLYGEAGGEVTLYLPPENTMALKLKNESGALDIRDVSCGEFVLDNDSGNAILKSVSCEEVSLKNDYGSVELDDFNCTDFELSNDSGPMKVENSSCGELSLTNEYGDLELKNVSLADFSIKNDAGSVYMSEITAGNADIITGTGNVKIVKSSIEGGRMESDSAALSFDELTAKALDIKSEYGEIKIRNADTQTETNISNDSGNVNIRYKDKPSDLAFDLKSEYGSIRVGLENADYDYNKENSKKGAVGSGAHKVSVVTDSGAISIE